jgi:hypothetical protein
MERGTERSSFGPYSPNVVGGAFSEVHLQNRAWGTGTPTESATSNPQGPEGGPLHAARPYEDALEPIRDTLSGR